jgi:hypothetical protein
MIYYHSISFSLQTLSPLLHKKSKMKCNCFIALSLIALAAIPTTTSMRMLRKNGVKPTANGATVTQPPTSVSSFFEYRFVSYSSTFLLIHLSAHLHFKNM